MKVLIQSYEDLTKEESEEVSGNGSGKEYATYIRIVHDNETILLESDAMEPEDATFGRDLSWITAALEKCFELGLATTKPE